MKELKDLRVVFFGTGPLAENALVTLVQGGLVPKFLITKPDSAVGRSKEKIPPVIAHMARTLHIPVLQPHDFKTIPKELQTKDYDVFVVGSYGKIIPDSVLNIPLYGTLNIHPSLLPEYRGPTPIETALLDGATDFGISIMFLDDKIDHGPLLAQRVFGDFVELPDATTEVFERLAGVYGASMLMTEVLLLYISGSLVAEEQDHSLATFTKKFTKETGLVSLDNDINEILNVYRACTPWPGCYFVHRHKDTDIRIKITEMLTDDNGITKITKVIPEGKKEMSFNSFKNGYNK